VEPASPSEAQRLRQTRSALQVGQWDDWSVEDDHDGGIPFHFLRAFRGLRLRHPEVADRLEAEHHLIGQWQASGGLHARAHHDLVSGSLLQ